MAISDNLENERVKERSKERREKPSTKVVIRRLPPAITQESFINYVSPLPDYDYMYTVRGDMALGENAFARVYINFVHHTDVFAFKEKFDNYVFLDEKGHEYPAVVEFASFQKIPRKRKPRPDPKSGSIESDPAYLEFLEALNEQPKQEEKPEYSYQFTNETKEDITTPLLDYVKQKRIDKQRIREERREERKRRDIERKKLRDEDRKWHEPRSPGKNTFRNTPANAFKDQLNALKEETVDKAEAKDKEEVASKEEGKDAEKPSGYKSYKYGEKKPYNKVKPKFDYAEKKDYKSRRDDYRDKDYRNTKAAENKRDVEMRPGVKKPKKYSERREERKMEAKKAEEKKNEVEASATADAKVENKSTGENDEEGKTEDSTRKYSNAEECYSKDNEPSREQKRIRNKDRPSLAIYRPGMLSKRKQVDGSDVSKETEE